MKNPDNAASAPKLSRSSEPILVVEDEFYLREVLVKTLRHLGYTNVDAACDGAEAWEALHEMRYSLVITDYKMPKVTGLELIERMRHENMSGPVILISGTMPMDQLILHPGLHIDALVAKPFTIAELSMTIAQLLRRPQMPGIINTEQLSLTARAFSATE